jgi:hypothetical protein
MKLNEFKNKKQLDELSMNQLFGNYGSAALKQVGNRLMGRAGGDMSIKDRMAKDKFIQNLVGRAAQTLDAAIQGGLVDPNIKGKASMPRARKPATPKPAAPAPQASAPAPQPAAPATPQKIDPKAAAALKGRLKAGQGIGQKTSTGFSNYVQGSGERFMGADEKGAPVFKKIQRESQYEQLNAIFESMLMEAESISSYLKRWLDQYLTGLDLTDPNIAKQLDGMIDSVQNTYGQDKGKKALNALANTAYALSYSNRLGMGAKKATPEPATSTPATATTPATAPAAATASTTQQAVPTPAQPTSIDLEKIKAYIDALDTKEKQAVFNYLREKLKGSQTEKPTFDPSAAPKEPISIGGQKIKPEDPLYSKIAGKIPAKV